MKTFDIVPLYPWWTKPISIALAFGFLVWIMVDNDTNISFKLFALNMCLLGFVYSKERNETEFNQRARYQSLKVAYTTLISFLMVVEFISSLYVNTLLTKGIIMPAATFSLLTFIISYYLQVMRIEQVSFKDKDIKANITENKSLYLVLSIIITLALVSLLFVS
jgi:hypothetical protein